jgi:hypothetical protein
MKKLIATVSVTAMSALGAFGLLGAGATSASASPGPIHVAVCTSLTNQINAAQGAITQTDANETVTTSAEGAASTALDTAVSDYGTALVAFVDGVDSHASNINVLTAAYQNANSALTTAIVNWSNAQTAMENAVHADVLNDLGNSMLLSFSSSFGCAG